MLIGTETPVGAKVFLLLLLSWTSLILITEASFADWYAAHNPLNIDIAPAPPPDLGPPLSAGASRDKSLLPAQIGAIVGAYLFLLCLVGLGLIIITRASRRQILDLSARARDIELAESQFYKVYGGEGGQYIHDPDAVGPHFESSKEIPNFSYPSPTSKSFKSETYGPPLNTQISESGHAVPNNNSLDNISPVDDTVVRANKEMMDRDLEDIYAHVMAQEEAKAKGVDVKQLPSPVKGQPLIQSRWSPKQPLLSPPPATSSKTKKKPQNLNFDDSAQSGVKPASKTASFMNALKSPIKSFRTPKTGAFPRNSTNSDTEPLSPRHYILGPLLPVDQNQMHHNRMTSHPSIAEHLSGESSPEEASPQRLHERPSKLSQRPILRQQPSDISSRSKQNRHTPPMSPTTTMVSSPKSPPLPGINISHSASSSSNTLPISSAPCNRPSASKNSASNPKGSLPFRAYEPTLSPTYTTSLHPSVGKGDNFRTTTKTTVLQRTQPLSPGPNTSGLRTPWTAGAVPYSPYQPQTPMIPITPRLVTRDERKMMKRAMPKTPVTEMVGSENDVWDSGY